MAYAHLRHINTGRWGERGTEGRRGREIGHLVQKLLYSRWLAGLHAHVTREPWGNPPKVISNLHLSVEHPVALPLEQLPTHCERRGPCSREREERKAAQCGQVRRAQKTDPVAILPPQEAPPPEPGPCLRASLPSIPLELTPHRHPCHRVVWAHVVTFRC